MSQIRTIKQTFDHLIIGSNAAALALGHQLFQSGQKVALITPRKLKAETEGETPAGKTLEPMPPLLSDLGFTPATEDNLKTYQWLNENFELGLEFETKNIEPKTFTGGKFIPFVGFGNRKLESADELSYYNVSEELRFDSDLEKVRDQWNQDIQFEIFDASEVTEIEVENKAVTSVIINGAKRIKAAQVYYFDSLIKLTELLPQNALSAKTRQKIGRSKLFISVCLQLTHKDFELTAEHLQPHFLMGNKDDFEPCFGRFYRSGEQIHSSWTSLIPRLESEDAEFVGAVLKNIKKQLKRAYPEIFDSLESESILVRQEPRGQVDLELVDGSFKELEGLQVWSPNFLESEGFLAEARALQKLNEKLEL